MRESNIKAVELYLEAIRSKDLSRAPIADDIVFVDPLTPDSKGASEWRAFLTPILPAFKDLRIKQHVAEGDFVATLWEAETIWGIIPVMELFRVEDRLIKEARAYFDPRPIKF